MYSTNNYFVRSETGQFMVRRGVTDAGRYIFDWTDDITAADKLDLIRAQTYAKHLDAAVHPNDGQVITVSSDDLQRAGSGQKVLTIRNGLRVYDLGPTTLHDEDTGAFIEVDVVRVSYCLMRNIPNVDLAVSGHPNVESLIAEMSEFYPGIGPNDQITIIRFDRFIEST